MGCLLPFSGGCSFPETQRAVTNALRRASAEARFSARAAAVQKGSVGCKRGFQISPTHFTFACADLLLDPARDSNFSFPPTQACTPGRSVDQERRIGPQVCGRSTSNSTSICVYGGLWLIRYCERSSAAVYRGKEDAVPCLSVTLYTYTQSSRKKSQHVKSSVIITCRSFAI